MGQVVQAPAPLIQELAAPDEKEDVCMAAAKARVWSLVVATEWIGMGRAGQSRAAWPVGGGRERAWMKKAIVGWPSGYAARG